MKRVCPRQFCNTREAAEAAYDHAFEKNRGRGLIDAHANLRKPYLCQRCWRWHIHPMRAIDENFRREAK